MRSERLDLIRSNPAHRGVPDLDKALAVFESPIEGAKIDRQTRLVSGMLTTTSVDAEGDVIMAEGIDLDTYYPKHVKSVYYNHDYWQLPVGTCKRLVQTTSGIWQQTYIKPGTLGDDLLTCIEAGCVAHYSIGIRTVEHGEPTATEMVKWPGCERVVRRSMAIEGSLVAMPANQLAKLDEIATKGLITKASAYKLGLPETNPAVGVRRKVLTLDIASGTLTDTSGGVIVV